MRRIIGSVFLLMATQAFSASQPAQPSKLDHPYVKLFTYIMSGPMVDTSQEHLEFIARNYGWINTHGGKWLKEGGLDRKDYFWGLWEYPFGPSAGVDEQGRSVGQRLKAINPDLVLTNYRNGSYINQIGMKEAGQAEVQLPLAIAVHDSTTKLADSISSTTTVLEVTAYAPPSGEDSKIRTEIYPFKASTTRETYSRSKKEYVAWMRLGDEILRIDAAEAVPGGKIRLTVQRGYWMTHLEKHEKDAMVLLPVYCGSRRPSGEEYYLSGLPDGESPQAALRYIMMQQRAAFWDFLGEKVKECIDEGYDGPWLDCNISEWINNSNAYGDRVTPYDVDLGRTLDNETYREYQQRKLDYLFQRFPQSKFYVNWIWPQFYFDNGSDRRLFSGEEGHTPVSGGAIELYAAPGRMDWHKLMKMHLDMRDNSFRVISWAKISGEAGDFLNDQAYLLYAYATHLLVYEHDKPLYYGSRWRHDNDPTSPFIPPDFVYWDLGEPVDRFTDISQAELKEQPGVYGRRFAKGRVLVNPQKDKPASVTLEEQMFNVSSNQWVSEVKLEPYRGALLLKDQ